MATIKFTDQTLKYITLFEGITNARVKDCLECYNSIYFIVDIGQLKRAVGQNGSNIKRLRKMLNKNIKVIEYSPQVKTFIKNIFHEFPIKNITIEESRDRKKQIAIVSVALQDKGKIIGLESKNLKVAREIINRYAKLDILIV